MTCTMPGCDRESADDRTRGGLCEEHAPNDTSKSLSMAIAAELLEAQPDLPRCSPDAAAPRRDGRNADLAEFPRGVSE